ncbi:molybdopterin molybdotransferase MoeA [Adlercreutzia sp. ZJ473]|uniref:molybdopterin molybdotransferase MoeA n=1 Tax=Adlercreutzia sp. ZJ473 TaxID=2722822 RepID=UPI001557323A|nr:molybdopterin molybdotransferase MoeA [Adlercreutzia sp. ZJ473]
MRDHSHHIELSREEAVSRMLERCRAVGFSASGKQEGGAARVEQVALDQALGRVLAQDVRAATDVPNALTCCMDSIAVHWAAFEDLPEGALPDTAAWVRGVDWEFANTGVAMPAGFDTAIVIEHVAVSDDEQHVTIDAAPSRQFAGTRAAGSQMKRGQTVIPAGALVTPDVAARIAGAGHSAVAVLARPRVAFIPTGNELVPANLPFAPSAPEKYAGRGHTFESNSLVVRGKVEQWGGELVPFDIVPDEYDAIKEAVAHAARVADIIVLNAGSSKGSDDWSVEVLEEMGEVVCHQTNHGPGHHSSYALVGGTPVVGISGPSGGASFTLNFYLRPVMRAFLGLDPAPERIPARLAAPFAPNKFGKPQPGKLPGEARPPEATEPGSSFFSIRFLTLEAQPDGTLAATPVLGHPGSPETQHANAYCMLPAGPGEVPPEPGSIIWCELR